MTGNSRQLCSEQYVRRTKTSSFLDRDQSVSLKDLEEILDIGRDFKKEFMMNKLSYTKGVLGRSGGVSSPK